MGYTMESMIKTLTELDVEIINTIEYYDTKDLPVANNDSIQEKVDELIRDL